MQAIVEFLTHPCCHTSRAEFCGPNCARRAAATTTAKTTTDEWAAFAADYVGIDRTTMKRAIARESSGLHSDCKPDIHGQQEAIELRRRLGAVKKLMKAEDIVDLRFLPAPVNAM